MSFYGVDMVRISHSSLFVQVESRSCRWTGLNTTPWRCIGKGGMASNIFNPDIGLIFVISFTFRSLYPPRKIPLTLWLDGLVGSRAGLEAVAKRKISAPAWNRTSVIHSVIYSVYWLRCRGNENRKICVTGALKSYFLVALIYFTYFSFFLSFTNFLLSPFMSLWLQHFTFSVPCKLWGTKYWQGTVPLYWHPNTNLS
jgi:hypothetical protein